MRKSLFLAVLATVSVAVAGTPAPRVTLRDAIDVWLAAAVRIGGPPDDRVLIDCFDGFENRVPANQRRLAAALEDVSGYLVAELVPEMVGGLHDDATFRRSVREKANWSPAVVEMVREAIRRSGAEPVGFLGADFIVATAPTVAGCTTGRCDCVPCSPLVKCDCKKAVYGPEGFPIDCQPPRAGCSTSAPVKAFFPSFDLSLH